MNDGGPIFPIGKFATDNMGNWIGSYGMSIRDWFAGQAMLGYLMAPGPNCPDGEMARIAYERADAMLKERDQSRQEGK